MNEPMSKLPPPPDAAATNATAAPADGKVLPFAHSPGKVAEWVVVDYNPAVMPGAEIFLPGLWKRMHDDGTFGMFFHEGPEMNFCQFGAIIASVMDRKVQLVIGHDAEGTAIEHAGLLMLEHILYNDTVKRAVGNFLFFHEYWHRQDSLQLGHAVLNHWFGVMDFDVIAGVTPRGNRAAIAFIKRLGFQIVGDIPGFTIYDGKPCASASSFMTREMWAARTATRG
jgi:hypothetical protein